MPDKFYDAGVPVPWPHGMYDPERHVTVCPDGVSCEHELEWGRSCPHDIGGGNYCQRLPPPGGWDDPDLPLTTPPTSPGVSRRAAAGAPVAG